MEAVVGSVRRTKRLVIVHEARRPPIHADHEHSTASKTSGRRDAPQQAAPPSRRRTSPLPGLTDEDVPMPAKPLPTTDETTSAPPKANKGGATNLTNPSLNTSGDYSDVYKCTLKTKTENTLVAVKFVRFGMHEQYHKRIIREIHLRMELNHPNIISLLGITRGFQGGSFPSLIFPWMRNGDLDCYIAYYGAGIKPSIKLSVSQEIASAVAYLHEIHVVHGNLETKNVLLGPGPKHTAYLTGFSLSTVLSGMSDECFKSPEKPQPGRVQFAAPECFTDGGSSLPIIESDIYSFGYILFHIFSGCLPWHDLKSDDIINEIRQRRMPSRPGGGGIDNALWNVIKQCCSFLPRDRRSAAEILAFLKQYKPTSRITISPDNLTRDLPAIPPKVSHCGGFADVRKCTLRRDGRTVQVAVKSIRHQSRDPPAKEQQRYLRELKVWVRLMHENILPLLGVAGGDYATGCNALVCPWMENGTLEKYLTANPRMVLRQKLQLLRDVAAGLRYLHSQDVRHGDLTNFNILVDVNGRAVVADFGLSYQLSDLHGSSYSLTAAARWMAPELITEHTDGPPTTQSDIYSFGTIMNYVLSRERPFDRRQDNVHVVSAVCNKEAPFTGRGRDVSGEHWKFIQRCLSNSTSSRPSAEYAYKFLQRELDSTK
ncbi:hypothetical protein AZE42_07022 [Rhizopogon vesiculosus]|uniref:Protein kinase domain-containing protein n=1 Tax=Rhizopogon vesiculosus TaxID=180088 RepID=A0A1J8R235_9AGAM|nr:hypothetical protein AZE42_07022 [Rhizopogon vesiculosus]